MGKYFGTDGVRGKANEGLTLDMSIKIGQYLRLDNIQVGIMEKKNMRKS